MVFYESPFRLVKTLGDFATHFGSDRQVAVCRELTKIYEETFRGTVEEAIEYFGAKNVKGEIVIVIEGTDR
jgi:16S rRNA (cytidine1402-2'-O)-methyltransferase